VSLPVSPNVACSSRKSGQRGTRRTLAFLAFDGCWQPPNLLPTQSPSLPHEHTHALTSAYTTHYKMVSSSLKPHQAELSFALFPRLTHSLALRLSFSPATTPLFTTTAGPPSVILSVPVVCLPPRPMSPLGTTNPWPTFGHWQCGGCSECRS
jgi:hypothetical protein